MISTLPAYGLPCTVCGRPATHVVVRDRVRYVHHADERASNCTVGNELPARLEPGKAAA